MKTIRAIASEVRFRSMRAWRQFVQITRLYCVGCGERDSIRKCSCGCAIGCTSCVDFTHHYFGAK